MSDDRHFRIDEFDIEDWRDQRMPEDWIQASRDWLPRIVEMDAAIEELKAAFQDSKLGDGTGLYEACGIDDYACDEELERLRTLDEKEDWSHIPVERMERCHAGPSFMNPQGFVFHLPAFLIAELNDQYGYGFIDHLTNPDRFPRDWMQRLTEAQRKALAALLEVVSHHPEYLPDPWRPEGAARIHATITTLRTPS